MKIKNNLSVRIEYTENGSLKTAVLSQDVKQKDIKYSLDVKNDSLKLTINPKAEIEMKTAVVSFSYNFNENSKVFVNGYQSWTDSREFSLDEKMKSINKIPSFIVKKYSFDKYGDYTFKKYTDKKGIFHGYSYSYIRNNDNVDFIGSLSEENGFTIINFNSPASQIVIEKDCSGFVTDKQFTLFDLCFLNGKEKDVFDSYFNLMKIKPLRTKPMSGYTSWYNHYQNISEKIIEQNLDGILSLSPKPDIFQIDDGYQTAVGDWLSIDADKFPNGLKPVSDKIKESGFIPGLWLAPFVCETKSDIFNNHKDWLLKDKEGNFVKAGSNWSGFYALDFYNDDVRNYIKKCFRTILDDWGFELVKLDFLYAVCLIPYNKKSRGQIMCEAMDFLRECVGDKMILGCGVPLAPCFGKVDFCRIGCDIGLDFDDNFIMRRMHRERVSTKNAMYNSIYRRQLDKRAFLNDPDVFLLRDNNIKLTKKEKNNLCIINALCGSLLFTSDNVAEYSEEKKQTYKNAYELLDCNIKSVKETHSGNFEFYYVRDGKNKKSVVNIYNK